jgi:hypothetical protein
VRASLGQAQCNRAPNPRSRAGHQCHPTFQLTFDVSQLRYETTFADTQNARVLVTGLLKMASGMASQFVPMNSTVGLVREQELWRVCDAPSA